jgi:hypothetical protein
MARRTKSQDAKTPKIKNNKNKTKMGVSYPIDGRFSPYLEWCKKIPTTTESYPLMDR